jgi:hypothetical protein
MVAQAGVVLRVNVGRSNLALAATGSVMLARAVRAARVATAAVAAAPPAAFRLR